MLNDKKVKHFFYEYFFNLAISNGTIVKYVYGNGLISSYETTSTPTVNSIIAARSGQYTYEITTEYQSYSYDLRGSVTSVSNENGTVTAEYSYSTYGERTVIEGKASILGYCARDGVLTETNGLIYMRARYYSTELMRFINEDIITGDISNSSSLNRYTYVEGNPATNVDPFGLEAARIMEVVGSIFTSNAGMSVIKDIAIISNELEYSKYLKEIAALQNKLDKATSSAAAAGQSVGHFRRFTRAEMKNLKIFAQEASDVGETLSKVSKGLTAVSVALDVFGGVYDNMKKDATVDEYIVDGVSDLSISLSEIGVSAFAGAKVGAAFGSFAPGVGNVVGAAVGAVTGLGLAVFVDINEDENGDTVRDKLKDDIYEFYKSITE